MKKILAIIAVILLVTAPTFAQEIDYCEGDFDCDGDCDGTDASVFKSDFGRSDFQNPCPSCSIDIPQTGQTTSYATGDDGDLEMGFKPEPNPRFTDNGDGTITDSLTGLIWLKAFFCIGTLSWNQALSECNGLSEGDCDLSDGSSPGDWRLPNINEQLSILDYGNEPALPPGHPFGPVSGPFWTSTTWFFNTDSAWRISTYDASIELHDKGNTFFVYCVRGGH